MERLDFIASLAKNTDTLLDVGCDHAYTVIKAITNYNVKRAIASDINIGPLNQAKENIYKYHLEDKIKLVLSDGLKNINEHFDTLIISGMGGTNIINILSDGLDKIKDKKLILSPHSDFYKLREFLSQNGFMIADEYSLNDKNKYYEVIIALPGTINYPSFDLKYGPVLLKKRDIIFLNHIKKELNILKEAIKNVSSNDTKLELEHKIKEIEMILND